MLDTDVESRILDILGNRNRRRIIELLRQKPCFVTEISERLMISPKAVIEHLQMMEEEQLLTCNQDEHRRKYYYLKNDIHIQIRFQQPVQKAGTVSADERSLLLGSLLILRKMVEARDRLIASLESLEYDISAKEDEVLAQAKRLVEREDDLEILFALGHYDLTFEELMQYSGMEPGKIAERIEHLVRKGIVEQMENRFTVKGAHAR